MIYYDHRQAIHHRGIQRKHSHVNFSFGNTPSLVYYVYVYALYKTVSGESYERTSSSRLRAILTHRLNRNRIGLLAARGGGFILK